MTKEELIIAFPERNTLMESLCSFGIAIVVLIVVAVVIAAIMGFDDEGFACGFVIGFILFIVTLLVSTIYYDNDWKQEVAPWEVDYHKYVDTVPKKQWQISEVHREEGNYTVVLKTDNLVRKVITDNVVFDATNNVGTLEAKYIQFREEGMKHYNKYHDVTLHLPKDIILYSDDRHE
ncbi:hypothetical protein [Paenibacillus tundrae]|uniref:hypothetical protein n=1 Tax=Paenibacillus tundrae TaxID=528187 RepID=UPI0022A8E770|nr:hypothetical protein [Paenibacillus tundrae]MCZ1267418.1 hypothetical protein [Paenibacillus tundrae]